MLWILYILSLQSVKKQLVIFCSITEHHQRKMLAAVLKFLLIEMKCIPPLKRLRPWSSKEWYSSFCKTSWAENCYAVSNGKNETIFRPKSTGGTLQTQAIIWPFTVFPFIIKLGSLNSTLKPCLQTSDYTVYMYNRFSLISCIFLRCLFKCKDYLV